jgi:hypothetical protein
MKTIAIARLRSKVNYTGPMKDILDSFYWCLNNFIADHPEYKYTYYNFSWGTRPKRDVDSIKDADVIIIPTENEFHAWVPNYLHPLNLKKCNEHIDKIKPYINNKKVILLRSDRADTEELYQNNTFSGCSIDIDTVDEDDFPMGIHVLKSYFPHEVNYLDYQYATPSDFVYWGTDKRKLPGGINSNDERHIILKKIKKDSEISSIFIGRFNNINRDHAMMKMYQLHPILSKSRTTLCFNWLSNTAVTSRYHEAMTTNWMIPLVWKDYDSTGRLGIEPWQRCHNAEEVVDKIKFLKNNAENLHRELYNKWIQNRPSKESTYKTFESLLLDKIKK